MRKKKGGMSKAIKVIPMSIATAAIMSNMIFASASEAKYIWVQDDNDPGNKVLIDLDSAQSSEEYRNAIKEAFRNGDSIVVIDRDGTQVEFGKNAHDATLDEMFALPAAYEPGEGDRYN